MPFIKSRFITILRACLILSLGSQSLHAFSQTNSSSPPSRQRGTSLPGVERLPALAASQSSATPALTVLTLQQAYDLALANNLHIKAAKAQIPEAQADVLIAKTRLNPNLNTDLGFPEHTYRVIGLEQPFEPPGKRVFRIRVAKDQLSQAQTTFEKTVFDVLIQVRQAYYNWFIALNMADMQQNNVKTLQSLSDIAKKRFDYGDVPELDVLQANMLLAQAQNDASQAQSQASQNFINLSALLGSSQFTAPPLLRHLTLTPQGTASLLPPLPALQSLEEKALHNRKELQENQLALQTERDRLTLFRISIIPNLILQTGYDKVTTPPVGDGLYATGKMDIPLFDHQQGNIAHAKAAYQRLLAERQDLIRTISTDVKVTYERALSHQQQLLRFQREILPSALEVDRLAQRSYQIGQTGIVEALLAHQSALNIRQKAVQTFTDYEQSISDLEAATGARLETPPSP